MDNLIDNRYFAGLLELPYSQINGETSTPSGEATSTEFDRLQIQIAKYQKKFLTLLFGSEVVPSEVSELVVNEATFTSPIANYVFCNVIAQYQSQLTDSGEKVHSATDSINISYKNKSDEAWDDMVEMCGEIRETLYDAGLESTYPTDYTEHIYSLSYFI